MESERPLKKRKTARKTAVSVTPRRITRGMTTDAARRAVFDTPELLENIISFLPIGDILSNAQRISRAWKADMQSSHSIQVKLWLKPEAQGILEPFANYQKEGQPGYFPPLLGMPIYVHSVQINPLLTGSEHMSQLVYHGPARLQIRPMMVSFDASSNGKIRPKSSRNQSSIGCTKSWERMQLADPPITNVLLHAYTLDANDSVSRIELSLREKGGITLGHVHDALVLASVPFGERENYQQSIRGEPVGRLLISTGKHDTP